MVVLVAQENNMSIKILFTKHFGQLIAQVDENVDGSYKITNPCVIQPMSQTQISFTPILVFTSDKFITMQKDEILSLNEPNVEIRNSFTSTFGGGIQLPNKGLQL